MLCGILEKGDDFFHFMIRDATDRRLFLVLGIVYTMEIYDIELPLYPYNRLWFNSFSFMKPLDLNGVNWNLEEYGRKIIKEDLW